jgi:hypothetical protein
LPDPSTLSWQEVVSRLWPYPGIEDSRLRREFTPEVQALWADFERRVQTVAQRLPKNEWLNAADQREIVDRAMVALLARSRTRRVDTKHVRGTLLRQTTRQIHKKKVPTAKQVRSVVPVTTRLESPLDDARRVQLQQLFAELSDTDRRLLKLAASADTSTVADMARETGLKFSAVAARRWRLWLRTHAILTARRPPE